MSEWQESESSIETCPMCEKNADVETDMVSTDPGNGESTMLALLICSHCGYEEEDIYYI